MWHVRNWWSVQSIMTFLRLFHKLSLIGLCFQESNLNIYILHFMDIVSNYENDIGFINTYDFLKGEFEKSLPLFQSGLRYLTAQ